ncbi:MAG: hypothetical protein IJ593_00475 [Lachnospiraceae bacterium]|nr:hypothetical protein [Lachnospiraceae bacterium]
MSKNSVNNKKTMTIEEQNKLIDELLADEDTEKENNDVEQDETNEQDDENQSFDDIINEILGEEEKSKTNSKEEFKKMVADVARDKRLISPANSIEEIDNAIEYKFTGDTHLQLFSAYGFESSLGDGYREKTIIKTSDLLEIDGTFNTSELRIDKGDDGNKLGKIVFKENQKTDSLVIKNVGVKGSFDTAIVSIQDTTYVDIDLDITDRRKCTYLLIDNRFDRVSGKINMTREFYDQLTNYNQEYLYSLSLKGKVGIVQGGIGIEVLVDGTPVYELKNIYAPGPGEHFNFEKGYADIKDILINSGIDA